MTSPHPPHPWRAPLRRMHRLVALGWFSQRFTRWLLLLAPPHALLLWILRIQRVDPAPVALLGTLTLLAALLDALLHARQHRPDPATLLARLDRAWTCGGTLLAAHTGRTPWPHTPPRRPLPLTWTWKPLLPPLLLAPLLLLMAATLPLPPPRTSPPRPHTEPPDWTTLETLADDLRQQDLAREEDLDRLLRDLETLRNTPRRDWYAPSGLEATDLLRERTRTDLDQLRQGLAQTARLLRQTTADPDSPSTARRETLRRRLSRQLRHLRENDIQPGRKSARPLTDLDPAHIDRMDPEALRQLQQQLQANARALADAMRRSGLPAPPGDLPGQGGIGRGGDDTDLTLRDDPAALDPPAALPLPEQPDTPAQIGENLQTRQTQHDLQRPDLPDRAGDLQTEGGGGEIIRRQDLLPHETEILERYFQ